MTGGGVNWGGAAFDPVNQILYANTSRAVHIVKLIPRAEAKGFSPPPGHDFGPQQGAPFAMTRAVALSPLGLLCNKPPWGEMVAVDLKAGKILWRSSGRHHGGPRAARHRLPWGTPLVNGVAITAGGLVFTGAMDAYLRAFDAKSGEELWQGRLPVPGVANPMTYLWKGEQYVAIGAGGHSESGTTIGDSVVAFRLARAGEAPSLWSRTIDRPGGRFTAKAIASGSWSRCWRSPSGAGAAGAVRCVSAHRCYSNATPTRCSMAPDRAAMAHEVIGYDHEGERSRQADGVCDIQPRAALARCCGPCSRRRRRRETQSCPV